MPLSLTRRTTFITTDKQIYKRHDVVFIEALVFDAFDKKPINLKQGDPDVVMTLILFDPSGNKVHESETKVE
jgi:hypothetical protein